MCKRVNPHGTPCICLQAEHNNWPPIHNKLLDDDEAIFPGVDQLCSGLVHIPSCVESGILDHYCLQANSRECRHRNVTLIVRHLIDTEERLYRYTYCKTDYRYPIHAEEFMITDDRLLVDDSHILVYSFLQPCHHSSGNNTSEYDVRSCTDLLIEWERDVLRSRGITIEIRITSIYKALWEGVREDLPDYHRYDKTCEQARQGMILLLRSRIGLEVMTNKDYRYVEDRVPGEVIYSQEYKEARIRSNLAIERLLKRLRLSVSNTIIND